jgi:hypothetical protein
VLQAERQAQTAVQQAAVEEAAEAELGLSLPAQPVRVAEVASGSAVESVQAVVAKSAEQAPVFAPALEQWSQAPVSQAPPFHQPGLRFLVAAVRQSFLVAPARSDPRNTRAP